MASQAEHKFKAETYLSKLQEQIDTGKMVPVSDATLIVALAQVHATLATVPDPTVNPVPRVVVES